MEMEMEVPTAEELEWLETHSLLPPPPPPPPPTLKSSKRPREEQAASKDDDEEWLRYSPPPPPPPPTKRRICISRFASDIPGDCFPITGPHGRRVYAKLNPHPSLSPPLPLQHSSAAPALLPHSIHTLTERVENKAFSKVITHHPSIYFNLILMLLLAIVTDDRFVMVAKALQESIESIDHRDQPPPPQVAATEQLWVDKYAPSSFTELLSDEHTNREVCFFFVSFFYSHDEEMTPSSQNDLPFPSLSFSMWALSCSWTGISSTS